jgi:signal transduction histidine kinase
VSGLRKAVRGLARRSSLPVEVVELPRRRCDSAAEGAAYFVVAEALTNAQKHAHAAHVRVRVTLNADKLKTEVMDDGVGSAAEDGGMGLQGLRDRVEALGGEFTLVSPAGGGTHITASIPATAVSS